MLNAGDLIELAIERPASGGRMIARHEGQIVLVSGAIPGERVAARIEHVEKRLAFAAVAVILQASPDRQSAPNDPLCGGCVYAHIALARQREIKAQVVGDAFARIGKHPLESPIDVAASPYRGYRIRARLHVRNGQVGFYREGTHQLCDAALTEQLHEQSLPIVRRVVGALHQMNAPVTSVDLSESLAGDQRALHAEVAAGAVVSHSDLDAIRGADLVSLSLSTQDGARVLSGPERIADPLDAVTRGRATGQLQRSARSFFQANRFLVPELVSSVIESVLTDGEVLDLYAGVGLFAVSLAGTGRSGITAVEADRSSGADLRVNASAVSSALTTIVAPVETYLARHLPSVGTVIVDPPRTGLSKEVVGALVVGCPRRVVYVSCDPPTMARDARGLLDSGYQLRSIRAFDLFPNTPHVETLAVFDKRPV
jgi:tRNA/tmRNA/rRNA uracil-C5-methylase (TrmA/RlmC/RlmD family)